jgi:hypothetical protein
MPQMALNRYNAGQPLVQVAIPLIAQEGDCGAQHAGDNCASQKRHIHSTHVKRSRAVED